VAAVQQHLHLLCGFTPTDEFVLRQLLNHDGMNKLSQLSVSVRFTLRVTCLDPFPYMLPKFSKQSQQPIANGEGRTQGAYPPNRHLGLAYRVLRVQN
jgi:hypothetical protein